MTVVVGVVLGLAVAAVLLVSQGAPGEALVAAAGVPTEDRPLLVRFIDRSRRFRRAGAIASLVLAIAAAAVLDAERDGGGVANGVELVVLASISLGGSILGSVAAEVFRFRRPRGPRVASLSVRDPESYRDPGADRRERVLLALSVAAVALSPVAGSAAPRVIILLAATVALAVFRRWVTARVALRGRPVLPAHLESVDDRVRFLATSAGLSRPIVTLAALLGSIQWAALVVPPDSAATTIEDTVNLTATVVSVALLGAAIGWWWQNRSFGLRPHGAGWLRRSAWLRFAGVVAAFAAALVLMRGVVVARRGG